MAAQLNQCTGKQFLRPLPDIVKYGIVILRDRTQRKAGRTLRVEIEDACFETVLGSAHGSGNRTGCLADAPAHGSMRYYPEFVRDTLLCQKTPDALRGHSVGSSIKTHQFIRLKVFLQLPGRDAAFGCQFTGGQQ